MMEPVIYMTHLRWMRWEAKFLDPCWDGEGETPWCVMLGFTRLGTLHGARQWAKARMDLL